MAFSFQFAGIRKENINLIVFRFRATLESREISAARYPARRYNVDWLRRGFSTTLKRFWLHVDTPSSRVERCQCRAVVSIPVCVCSTCVYMYTFECICGFVYICVCELMVVANYWSVDPGSSSSSSSAPPVFKHMTHAPLVNTGPHVQSLPIFAFAPTWIPVGQVRPKHLKKKQPKPHTLTHRLRSFQKWNKNML